MPAAAAACSISIAKSQSVWPACTSLSISSRVTFVTGSGTPSAFAALSPKSKSLRSSTGVNVGVKSRFTPVLLRKDLDLGLKAAKQLGVPLPVTQVTRDLVNKAVEAGHTDCDFAILLEQQAKASGMTLTPENVAVDDGLKKKQASA